ncbi:MAG TPA: ABC transporter ATP-binding protein [Deltaproteobacteria bacterium]|jgi:branched-chain amino acid transport system ATP-binding protein|nr:ABC transporter ATP-binding protein [Deltaproteobacteria bacterium]HRW80064.1 ABC transporter ATP-binding protein [Desulfomonilia bacterium]HNS89712.1 ABC transporter ATP-binding protein [Deltaproteobacteria bacterium]HOA44676.1 ABC transporter ATP-binding protein [Deltaproteobacteria bacterium]HOC75231.1 ABC transporter ATP-binding protein [Deltaproteobacteria bacterium]
MALLEIKNINCFYGDVQVIYDVSMHIDEGEVISLIGANGAGKSTMLRTISGLMKPRSGEVIFENQPVQNLRPEKIVERGIVQVPEGRKLFSLMTVRENLDVGAHNSRAYPHLTDTIKDVYKLLPRLEEREKQQAITLSGGEQQMVAIGRAMMAKPKILMMDEPSLGLAPVLIKEIFTTIRKIADQGTTVLLVEQDVQHSLSLSDRGYVLEHGRIVMEGKGKELLENPNIREAYLGI